MLQGELKLFTGMNLLIYDRDENWNSEKAFEALNCISSDNRCGQLVPLYDSVRIKKVHVSANVLACLNMFL